MEKKDFDELLLANPDDPIKLSSALEDLERLNSKNRTVFGVDIFEYSKMKGAKQFSVPYVVECLLQNTLSTLRTSESATFDQADLQLIEESRIDTGDGFFIVLNDPLKAFVFGCHFAIEVEAFQTRNRAITFMKLVNDFTFRYCISSGPVFVFGKKYYGEAIIKCARIMAKDKLNRCLIDKESVFWFNDNYNGIESLQESILAEISLAKGTTIDKTKLSLIFPNQTVSKPALKSLIVSKIGKIDVKQDLFDVYNLFVQISVRLGPPSGTTYPIVCSLGSVNASNLGTA